MHHTSARIFFPFFPLPFSLLDALAYNNNNNNKKDAHCYHRRCISTCFRTGTRLFSLFPSLFILWGMGWDWLSHSSPPSRSLSRALNCASISSGFCNVYPRRGLLYKRQQQQQQQLSLLRFYSIGRSGKKEKEKGKKKPY